MCVGCPGAESAFGNNQYIKLSNSDFVAIQGSVTMERLLMGDVRIPYNQLIKSRIILKEGQVNYLLNHLGLGDNATFLAMKATYNSKSVNKEDNYILWNYYDNFSQTYPMAEMMVLTGSPENRIKQLYLTNPNTKYPVVLDVMIANIDDQYSFFPDIVNQTGTTFTGLSYTDIHTYVINQSIVIRNSSLSPLVYITLSDINSIQRTSNLISIDNQTLGDIFLLFETEYDAIQANSLLMYILENSNINIGSLDPLSDDIPPVIYFQSFVDGTGATISSSATSSIPSSTLMGNTFSTTISLSTYGELVGSTYSLSKDILTDILIDNVVDNRDGTMSFTSSYFIISGTSGNISQISQTGSYALGVEFSDIAQNNLDDIIINLNIII